MLDSTSTASILAPQTAPIQDTSFRSTHATNAHVEGNLPREQLEQATMPDAASAATGTPADSNIAPRPAAPARKHDGRGGSDASAALTRSSRARSQEEPAGPDNGPLPNDEDRPPSDNQSKWPRYKAKVKTMLHRLRKENYVHTADTLTALINSSSSPEANGDGGKALWLLTTRICFCSTVRESPADAELLAHLCLRLKEQLSEDVQDGRTKRGDGTYLAGGELFRLYLLRACRITFDIRLGSYGIPDPLAKRQPAEDEDTDTLTEGAPAGKSIPPSTSDSNVPQGPGHLRLLGELYHVGLLHVRIMHECVRALLQDVKGVEDACTLLSVVGKTLDVRADAPARGVAASAEKQREWMDAYFARMQALVGTRENRKGTWRQRAKVQVSVAWDS
ncbi:hypothetical protein GY45DRAFT_1329091 [Cubamyces sp. BRFM 1775]|nr:hypothetical protein GY45DRAFT_1329091 [Cubamyces sp. BRFM 1775]